ncbi:MAG: SOS response-associated peptidase family protein, partial [Comamonas sp.]
MSSQYENLPQPGDYAAFFKVTPVEAPTERLVRANRVSGMVRGVVVPSAEVEAAPVAAPAQTLDTTGTRADTATEPAAPAAKPKPEVQREWVPAQFGFVASWVKSASDAKLRASKQVVARNETVSTVQAYRDAWLAGQRCIIPMQAFFEDDLRSGKPVSTRISRVDGEPMGGAGVWSSW